MSPKRKRKKARSQRRTSRRRTSAQDPHVEVATGAMLALQREIARFANSADPVGEARSAYHSAITRASDALRPFHLASVIEAARIGTLPWAPEGSTHVNPDAVAARAELITLLALVTCADSAATSAGSDGDRERHGSVQPITDAIHGGLISDIDEILRLAQVVEMLEADRSQPLAYVSALMRGSEIWVRNTSYPDMLESTVLSLFSEQRTRSALRAALGFDAAEAIAVLTATHDLQVSYMNERMRGMQDAMERAMQSAQADGHPDAAAIADAKRAWRSAWEGDVEAVAVTAEAASSRTQIPVEAVRAVLEFFAVRLESDDPRTITEEFARGNNPLRTHPVVSTGDRFMLVHNALILGAVREALEQHLKSTPAWEVYQKHRGDLLESRTRENIVRLLPEAHFRDGFEYYLPASPGESGQGPANYTKRVEGDHLVTIDDVALIIEDKAVALAPSSRAGETRRLRRDLASIVTKAAEQSGRLRDAIVADKGIRVHGEGWVDLSHIREIHTIAVSLEDLTSISTATAELVRAGILTTTNVPWTVSIHDLELIARLVDHAAEFLLYLRRRRNPFTTVFFTAPDELDLFLEFFSSGLWVEPNPDDVRGAFPFLGETTTADRRRFERQVPAYITSRTDPLDAWHYAELAGGASSAASRKPRMSSSPLRDLIDHLRQAGAYGWLSTSATLLAGSSKAQSQMAQTPRDLLRNPFGDGRPRSLTMPVTTPDPEESWLLVWMTRPAGSNPDAFSRSYTGYLQAKKLQLGIPRGALLIYSEQTGDFESFHFDGHLGPLDATLEPLLASLQPPEALTGRVHPAGRVRPGSRPPRGTRKR